ncbi:hypothetical protein Tco_1058028 [Tanacetum coccineum]|uniref:Uncharacterized protein n=1 Tax=Tanacetum coccineum TaxID=301880 RepID=A0ABQ5H765_9ASTR
MKKSSGFIRKGKHDPDFDSFDDEGGTRKVKMALHDNSRFILEDVSQGDQRLSGYDDWDQGKELCVYFGSKVAQRRLKDKQLKENTNTDCLVKEQQKVHLSIKMVTNIMVSEVPRQEGAKGNVAEKKKVKESIESNIGKLLRYKSCRLSGPRFEVLARGKYVEYRLCLSVTRKVEFVRIL